MLNLPKTLKSFKPAIVGIGHVLRENNMHFHVFASGVVVFAGLYFQLAVLEWMALTLTISLVFSMEILNSAVEDIANTVKDKLNLDYEATSRMRDIAAGGVLVSAIGAVVMGLLIFGPKVIDLVRF